MHWVIFWQVAGEIHDTTNVRFRYFSCMHITMRTQETVRYDLQSYIKLEILHKGSLCSENESIGGAMYDKKTNVFPSSFPAEAAGCLLHNKKWPFEASSASLPKLDKNIHLLYHQTGLKGKYNSDIKKPAKWFPGSSCFCLTCQDFWHGIKEPCIPQPRCLSREWMF